MLQASTFRAKCQLPVISWCHPVTGAVLARSSRPMVGIMMNMSNMDENLVAALCSQFIGGTEGQRKLYICDARPRTNALANGALGGGPESSANYFQSEIVFFGIDNIHATRDSLSRLRDYLDTYGTTSSNGMSSYLAKKAVERKTRDVSAAVESFAQELKNEKQLSNTSVNPVKRASRANGAIKRAIQSLGCKNHFSNNGDTTIDIQNYKTGSPQDICVFAFG